MSRLLQIPHAHPNNAVRIADFAEIECLRRNDGSVSITDIVRILCRGRELSDDDATQHVDEAFKELAQRTDDCGADPKYPFEVSERGTLLVKRFGKRRTRRRFHATIYVYLLLATRMNMKTERKQAGEDATVLFELLCKEVAVSYWGGPSEEVDALVFGTARTDDMDDDSPINRSGFEAAVNHLCNELQEGYRFESANSTEPVTAKDGRLDVVVWRRFADRRVGQLIGFGQCKTGESWEEGLSKLQPPGFCQKWLLKSPAVKPVRLYFVADRVILRFYDRCTDGGILFDRCRIMEHVSNLPASLHSRLETWVGYASSSNKLRL